MNELDAQLVFIHLDDFDVRKRMRFYKFTINGNYFVHSLKKDNFGKSIIILGNDIKELLVDMTV